jgi:hypothetical protein
MAKYRKKPIVTEAFKWTGGPDQIEDPDWIIEALRKDEVAIYSNGGKDIYMTIETLEGTMTANVGDYVIRGINGEIYPCKPDIFEKTYELVES